MASQASQAPEKCSFCQEIDNAIAKKTPITAFISSDFLVKPPFKNLIHKDCECGRMFMNPPKDLPTLKVAMLKVLPSNPVELKRNACGCLIYTDPKPCMLWNTFNCCKKCSKAIEMEKTIQERDKTQPFAILVECSCHFVQSVISVSTENDDEQVAEQVAEQIAEQISEN